MKTFTLAATLLAFMLVASPQEAAAATVSARITNKCSPKTATIVVPRGKKAMLFTVRRLANGVKCRVGGKPDSKGWGITMRGRKLFYWSQWKNKKPHVIGGPLKKLQLKPGTYHVFVDGGRGAEARITYSLR